MTGFNMKWDEEFENELVQMVQQGMGGCFTCEKANPQKTCSRCHLAKYCDQACQKKDWKDGHKESCKAFCDNRAEFEGVKGAMPICLFGCGVIDEQSFDLCMIRRQNLYLAELQRQKLEDRPVVLGCSTAVISAFGKIRLVIAANFVDSEGRLIKEKVIMKAVDEGAHAEQMISPPFGSGKISDSAKKKVLKHWVDFCASLGQIGASVFSITYGRGLMFIGDDKEFQSSINSANGGEILWFPDPSHCMNDVMGAAMGAFWGAGDDF